MDSINYDAISLQDCIAMHEILKREMVIEKGHIVGFVTNEEEGNERKGIGVYKSFRVWKQK